MPTPSSPFGARLRELRHEAGLTQHELADRAGVKYGAVRDLEQGVNRQPLWDTVQALASALGVDCTAFATEPTSDEKPSRGRPKRPASES